jgi:hypothetical protein
MLGFKTLCALLSLGSILGCLLVLSLLSGRDPSFDADAGLLYAYCHCWSNHSILSVSKTLHNLASAYFACDYTDKQQYPMTERPNWRKPSKYQLGFEYSYRPVEQAPGDILRFTSEVKEDVQVVTPSDAGRYLLAHVFTPFEAFEQEEVWALLLNNRNKITHQSMIYRGTINTVQIRIGELFKPALRCNAASILVSHCHPSGEVTPSPEDIAVTEQIATAGNLLGVPMLDHLIIGRGRWYSLKERGYISSDTLP